MPSLKSSKKDSVYASIVYNLLEVFKRSLLLLMPNKQLLPKRSVLMEMFFSSTNKSQKILVPCYLSEKRRIEHGFFESPKYMYYQRMCSVVFLLVSSGRNS